MDKISTIDILSESDAWNFLEKTLLDKMPVDISNENKVDLNYALYSYLKVSQSNVIEVSSFVNEYLPHNLRDGFTKHMLNKGFPSVAVIKDLEYLNKTLKTRKISFSSKVKVIAPTDNFKDIFHIERSDPGYTYVRIAGKIEEQG